MVAIHTVKAIIRGTGFQGPESIACLRGLANGDFVDICPEPTNPVDASALAVYSEEYIKLGYVAVERIEKINKARACSVTKFTFFRGLTSNLPGVKVEVIYP